jgi:hypothetical protein
MPVETKTAGDAAVLEIERFEWVTPERIEIAGYWSGLRGRRFMRPTLVLRGEGETKRVLALLEHKPWTAAEGEEWIAAFAWNGDVVKFESAEMNVGSGIDLELPPPRMRPGKPRRFRQRVEARDASRDLAPPAPQPKGLVSDAPMPDAPKAAAKADAPKATGTADSPGPRAKADAPKAAAPKAADASAAAAKTADAPKAAATASKPAADPDATQPLAATAEADRLRKQRDELRRERDQALEKLRGVRGELEAERQSREQVVGDARADEREKANRMLVEGAELRAAVERQREIAYLERDDAKKARDEAVAARDKALEERDSALAQAKQARHERKEAFHERDRAVKAAEVERDSSVKNAEAERDRAIRIRKQAEAERDEAVITREDALAERNEAVKERDEILRVHERGLPVKQPKPRFLPEEHEERSEFDIWGPRASALGVLLLCAFIVLRLFACG